MSTVATPTMEGFARDWKAIYRSAKISGIVGDPAHQKRGGYHISRKDNPSGNYSIVRPDDRVGPTDAAAAVDMNLSPADMVTCTKRLAVAFKSTSDPRRKYLNGFNGWDGSGDATRFDIYARKSKVASPDHKWHVHLEFRRKYVNSNTAMDAVLSLLRGETAAAYLHRIGVTPVISKAATPTPTKLVAPPWPGKVFSRHDNMKRDSDLAKWQARMIARGWKSIGAADGIFGAKTESACRKFQALCKVTIDGDIGRVTWALPWTRPLGS